MKTLALLIDGDNAQLSTTKHIIQFCEVFGTLKIKKAYGDWKKPPLSSQSQKITELDINLVQQSRVTPNATDFRLSMDIGSMIDKHEVDIYVIVSSDNHFTVACEQIRQKGAQVIGIGSKNSVSSKLQKACNEFYDIEEIVKNPSQPLARASISPTNKPTVQDKSKSASKSKVKASPTPKTQDKGSKSAVTISTPKTSATSKSPSKSAIKTDIVPKSQPTVQAKPKTITKPKVAVKTKVQAKPVAAPKIKTASKVRATPKPKTEPNSAAMLEILINTYQKAPQKEGWVNLSQLGDVRRQLKQKFGQGFASKPLSAWFKAFPHKFEVTSDRVRMK